MYVQSDCLRNQIRIEKLRIFLNLKNVDYNTPPNLNNNIRTDKIVNLQNPEGIDVHKSIDWNEIKPRTSCQPPVTDNGEAVPSAKENDEKNVR